MESRFYDQLRHLTGKESGQIGKRHHLITLEDNLGLHETELSLLKIHGSVSDYAGLIHSSNSYRQFSDRYPILETKLKTELFARNVVFTGCAPFLKGHQNEVRTLAYSPDGNIIASGSNDATIRLWDSATGNCYNILKGNLGPVYSVQFCPNGKFLVSAGLAGRLQYWDVQTGKCFLYAVHHDEETWITYLADGRFSAGPKGIKLLGYRDEGSMRVYPAEQFKDHFHQPEAIKEVMSKYL